VAVDSSLQGVGGGGRLQCEFVEAQKGGFCTGWKNEK